MDFVDQHRGTHGVEPICKVLQIAHQDTGGMQHCAVNRSGAAPEQYATKR